jgi:hypothetical protein
MQETRIIANPVQANQLSWVWWDFVDCWAGCCKILHNRLYIAHWIQQEQVSGDLHEFITLRVRFYHANPAWYGRPVVFPYKKTSHSQP